MVKEETALELEIKKIANEFLETSKDKEINIISHFDTDGITSAAIMIETLKKLDKKFSIKIIKSLEKSIIEKLPKNKINFFLDLASGSLKYLEESGIKDIFIIDHHQISKKIPSNVKIINSELHEKQKISSSGLTYLFCREIDKSNKDYAKLAILGMIGDNLEKEIDNLNNDIINQAEIKRKRSFLIYPSTRPLNRVLEFSSYPYIPGVTGDTKKVLEFLRECDLKPENGKYKSLIELNEQEMKKLVTSIMLRKPKMNQEEIIGDIFLIKFFNKLEDAREISAKINACSRLGKSYVALQLCMEINSAKKEAETIYVKYKQHLINALKFTEKIEKIENNEFVLINAKDNIKDTIIGTIASIISNSGIYEPGKIIIAMAYDKNKIKISARLVGKQGRNLKQVLSEVIEKIGGEVGGHKNAAGAIIEKTKEDEFIKNIIKNLEIPLIKI